MSLEIEAGDVVRLMLQFCKENGLMKTMNALQEEAQISLNTVDSVEVFVSDIASGHWDAVLQTVANLRLPHRKMALLYEQIVLELAELRETDTARAILRQTETMQKLKTEDPERYLRLEHLLQKSFFDLREAYPDGSKEKRRAALAQALVSEVTVVPPSRMLALIGQALKWQQHQGMLPAGTAFDLFRGTAPAKPDEEDAPPQAMTRTINFGVKSHAEVSKFSPDGQYLISGSSDGFIEVWDFNSAKLNKNLKYQADDEYMMHDDTVVCLGFSRDSELLASGSGDGKIKVWKVSTGQCVRRFEKAHNQGVTSVSFTRDGTQLLSSSFDTTLRMHGLKSGKTLKEFRGHTTFVNDAIFTTDQNQILSACSAGTVKLWDTKSTDCIVTFRLPTANPTIEVPIHTLMLLHKNADHVVICNRSPSVYLATYHGQVVKTFNSPKTSGGDFVHCILSPHGDWLYCLSEDGMLHSFNVGSGALESSIRVAEKDPIGLCHHPHRNLVGTYADDRQLKLWKP